MSSLAFTRSGAGAPLVLLHGIGSSRHAWDPIIPMLAERFDVLAIDLPGFGDSEPLPEQTEPHPAVLAASVADFLQELGLTTPHIVGNSMGGWVALELVHIRPAASMTLLSPAGLWRGAAPLYQRASLRLTRWLTEHATSPLSHLVNYRLGRIMALGQTHGRPWRITPEYARTSIHAMASGPGFWATYKATTKRCYLAPNPPLSVPTTVVFGSRDFLLLPWSRHLDQLPPGTRVGALPGCGHVPMADDPTAVTTLITKSAHLPERTA